MINSYYAIGFMIIAFGLGSLIAIKAVQLGMKFKIQVSKGEEPNIKVPFVSKHIEKKEEIKENQDHERAEQEAQEIISEWVGGGF